MANRVELNEMEMANVVGGAFSFYTKNGVDKCYVDNYGSYYVSPNAFNWVVGRCAGCDPDPADVINEALAAGYFWK